MTRLVALLLALMLLATGAGAEIPLRVGHSEGATRRLAGAVRSTLSSKPGFHVSLAIAPDDLSLLRATLAGDFQLAWIRSSALTNFHRPWGLLSVPFLFPDRATEVAWLARGDLLYSTRGRGLRGLAVVPLGERFFACRQPLNSLTDLRGLRVQVPRDRFRLDLVQELGAEAVPSVAVDLTADTWDTNAEDYLASRERAAHYPHTLGGSQGLEVAVLVANERAFERMPDRERDRLLALGTFASGLGRYALSTGGPADATVVTLLPPPQEVGLWRDRLRSLRERSLRLIGAPWTELGP